MSPEAIPEVSVVIAYYKAAQWLPSQLDALAHQVNPPTFEVIIADNEGSTELPTVIADFRSILDIRIINATDRKGCGAARNRGVDHAHGNLIAFCDADDIVGPQWIRSLTDVLQARDVLATGPLRLDRINSEVVWRTTMGTTAGEPRDLPILQYPFTYLGYLPFAYGANIAMKRALFLNMSGFDETFVRGDEDVDLSWRAIESGIVLELAPSAVLDYRQRSTAAGVWRQRRNYARAQVDMWERSRLLDRPVNGMSLRWTLTETAKLIPRGLRAMSEGQAQRYSFAAHAGDVIGNLQGQWEQRVRPRLTARLPNLHRRPVQ
ncbi:hypothetical protein C0Z10_12965 [Acidipropionibacterium jensenii]|uniref:Glycosyltransferase 2-like domain-containing protein n=1 Tax=Acidipropionibacterium jensenii TaxID=1749 RepID=A0A3T0S290_9ACTN|nr:glycosyltransferase [Acidipropionibacterium jensenii]AZZ40495.1 hypothetical protein C0Z10_12965 [Acidipropionibacterium jensenii]